MGHCNHLLPTSVYHSPHVEHALSLLLDLLWPQATSPALQCHWVWKASWSTTVFNNSILQSLLITVDWKCFGDGWCLMDAFRRNCFIRYRQAHSNNRWHKFHGSIRKFFGCMDHNLAWLYFSANVFAGSAYVIHDLFKNIAPANSWKINLDRNWAPIISLHKTTLVNDLPHSFSTVSSTFLRQLIYVILLWSEFSVTTTTLSFLISLVAPLKWQHDVESEKLWFPVGALNFILLIISIALSEIDMS